jgi:glucose/arabinose dehydrogenase
MSAGMRARMRIALVLGCIAGLLAVAPRAGAVGLQPVGTFNSPIYVTSPPGDPRLFVVERGGTIQVIHDGVTSEFLDISSLTTNDGERGLLSMAFDPSYASNGLFYVYYTGDGADAGGQVGDIHIDEFHVSGNPNVANPGSRRTVMTFSHAASNHNGGQLQFGPDGLLYISVGDNANSSNAQSLANPYGKVLRIDPHGAGPGAHGVPSTNPFVGVGGATQEAWSLGLRNPWRFSFDRLTGDLVIGDVGQTSWEEIDLAPASTGAARGANFGWPSCEGFEGSCPGTTAPVFAYPHSDPGGDQAYGCAIMGGYVYRGSQIPELAGRYLYADLCTGELRSIQLGIPLASGDRAETAPGALDSPWSFGQDAGCELYVTNGSAVDKIIGSGSGSVSPACPVSKAVKKKCKKRKHHKKNHRAAASKKQKKKHKKKRCKKRKHKKKR